MRTTKGAPTSDNPLREVLRAVRRAAKPSGCVVAITDAALEVIDPAGDRICEIKINAADKGLRLWVFASLGVSGAYSTERMHDAIESWGFRCRVVANARRLIDKGAESVSDAGRRSFPAMTSEAARRRVQRVVEGSWPRPDTIAQMARGLGCEVEDFYAPIMGERAGS